jgi:hypothetical protein
VPVDGTSPGVGPSVEGAVAEGVHRFEFSGDLTDVRVGTADAATVFVDGTRVDAEAVGSTTP